MRSLPPQTNSAVFPKWGKEAFLIGAWKIPNSMFQSLVKSLEVPSDTTVRFRCLRVPRRRSVLPNGQSLVFYPRRHHQQGTVACSH
jgi:hypothetical protein